jgi:hypothetical protein
MSYYRKASHLLNKKNQGGTKFKLFVQPRYIEGFKTPETIRVSLPPDQIKKGPSDSRMYVVDVKNKLPYGEGCPYLPQFFDENGNPNNGNIKYPYFDPPKPNSEGHYDEIDINSRSFINTTMYATIRFGLDVWESHLGPIKWVTQKEIKGIPKFEKLELDPLIDINNAMSGPGYLEFGYGGIRPSSNFNINEIKPYCENFDVLCHELGHNIIFSIIGFPEDGKETDEYSGFHESTADIIAIITSLHFDTVVNKLLENTKGNLFTINNFEELGELSNSKSIRHAFNQLKMSNVSREPHNLSEPLTGAIFDVIVEVYQKLLVQNNLISEDLAKKSINDDNLVKDSVKKQIQKDFDSAYVGKEQDFKENLLKSRDYISKLLGNLWKITSPNNLKYTKILENIIKVENDISQEEQRESYVNIIENCFKWRGIYLTKNKFVFSRPRKIF